MHLVRAKGRDEAGAIVLYRGRGALRRARPSPFTQYSCVLLRRPSDEAAVHQRRSPLEALLCALEPRYRHLLLLVSLQDPRPAQWRGWDVRPLFTYRLSPNAQMASWSEATRRAYRKSAPASSIEENSGSASDIVRWCRRSYARNKRRLPAEPEALTGLVDRLCEAGCARLFTARRGGQLEGGLAALHDGQTAHYWIAGSQPGPAMTVLVGRALQALAASGVGVFDFVGANTPSIAEFKRHFGPRLTPYYRLERRAPILGRSQSGP